MKPSMHNKPLHKTGKTPLKPLDEIKDGEQSYDAPAASDSAEGEKPMGHVEEMMDSLNDDEAKHAHGHLSKRLNAGDADESDTTNLPEPSFDDFEKAKKD